MNSSFVQADITEEVTANKTDPVTLTDNTNYNVATGGDYTFSGAISGNYWLNKTGPGTLTLGAVNANSGTTISGGILKTNHLTDLGGAITINGGQLNVTNTSTSANKIKDVSFGTEGGTLYSEKQLRMDKIDKGTPFVINVAANAQPSYYKNSGGTGAFWLYGKQWTLNVGENSTFTSNAYLTGGGRLNKNGAGRVEIKDCLIENLTYAIYANQGSVLFAPTRDTGGGDGEADTPEGISGIVLNGGATLEVVGLQKLTSRTDDVFAQWQKGIKYEAGGGTLDTKPHIPTATTHAELLAAGGGNFRLRTWNANSAKDATIEVVDNAAESVFQGNLNVYGATATFNIGTNSNLDCSAEIWGAGAIVKTGAGTLTLSGVNDEYTGSVTVNAGAIIATNANALGTGPVINNTELVFDIASGSGLLNQAITGAGSIFKRGLGTLQALNNTEGAFSASAFAVDAGRLDFQGYYTGALEINADGTFSPGNSVGTANVDGTSTFDPDSIMLMEIDDSGMDLLNTTSIAISAGSLIDILAINGYDIQPEESHMIINSENALPEVDWNSLLTPTSSNLWSLSVLGNQVWATAGGAPPESVPEPST